MTAGRSPSIKIGWLLKLLRESKVMGPAFRNQPVRAITIISKDGKRYRHELEITDQFEVNF
jgi:hypothetical protein